MTTQDITGTTSLDQPPSKVRRTLTLAAWVSFGLFCLLFFTFIKLPRERLKAYIDGAISSALSERGITYSATETDLSFFFGVTYTLKGVTLYLPPPAPKVSIEELEISPSLLPMIFGIYKADIEMNDPKGSLDALISVHNTKTSVDFTVEKLDLGRFAILPLLAGIQGSGLLDGKGSIKTDTTDLTQTDGYLDLDFTKLVIDAQTIFGFPIPKISVSAGSAEIEIPNGKAQIKTLKLGKPGHAEDDIQANISGQITLGKIWTASQVDLNTRFSLSQNILKPLILLDAILGSGKQPDGSYAFHLTGPILSPTPSPLKPGE